MDGSKVWVRPVEGMGLGMFAAEFIPKGTVFLEDSPIIEISTAGSDEYQYRVYDICKAYHALSPDAKKEYDSLHSDPVKEIDINIRHRDDINNWYGNNVAGGSTDINYRLRHQVVDKLVRACATFWTNTAATDFKSSAVFPNFSRSNHSCVPNTSWGYRRGSGPGNNFIQMKARRDIQPGEQIFVEITDEGSCNIGALHAPVLLAAAPKRRTDISSNGFPPTMQQTGLQVCHAPFYPVRSENSLLRGKLGKEAVFGKHWATLGNAAMVMAVER
ncbi:hypothetical protein GGS23DRAFT_597270 [Durotheca rogersii]|uniref:uncharacterized protein n=1 Tax=Durotheca rogersii TaxID=419775 RepID=UPI0022200611|nr:uncharacterized protein GGS23DRAFT_597270 [Durotheca rogersii]KAI5862970.1 hypothetical protein GGS23DRAFT_597270 [Durotheca rogersii]